MSLSDDSDRIQVDPAPREYAGYSPSTVNDFPVRRPSDPIDEQENLLLRSSRVDPPLKKDVPRSDKIALGALFVFLVLFFIFFIIGITAPCKVGLCGNTDYSSILQTRYNVEVYDFEAPLKYAWAAIAVFGLACVVSSTHYFALCKKETGDDSIMQIGAYVRNQTRSFFITQVLYMLLLLIALFVLVVVAYSPRAAGCYAIGAILTLILSGVVASVATAGNIRTARWLGQSNQQVVQTAMQTSTIITIATYAFALGGPALAYMIFRDLRALSGYVIAAITVTLFLRISGGIYYNAARFQHQSPERNTAAAQSGNRGNSNILAESVGTIAGKTVGEALQTFAAFTIAVVSTSILASQLPYFGENKYGVCVFNHLNIDHACVGYTAPRQKVSFAATICRANNFYQSYPSLSTWASNSAFVALPFILGLCAVLVTVICTALCRKPAAGEEVATDEGADTNGATSGAENARARRVRKVKTVMAPVYIRILVGGLLTIVCGAGACFGLFGSNSAFFKETTGTIERFVLPALTEENMETRCRPVDMPAQNLTDMPKVERVSSEYRALDSYGRLFPRASETQWRLFVCVVLGVCAGLGIGCAHAWVGSAWHSAARDVAKNGEFGESAVLAEGFGYGFLVSGSSFAAVLTVVLGCYGLHGGYGVGLAAIAMVSVIGPALVMACCDGIAQSGLGVAIAATGRIADELQGDGSSTAWTTATRMMSGIWQGATNGALCVATAGLALVVLQDSDAGPSSRQVGGSAILRPWRHVSDIAELSVTDLSTAVGIMLGAMMPLLVWALVLAGANRAQRFAGRAYSRTNDAVESIKAARRGAEEAVVPAYAGCAAAGVLASLLGRGGLIGGVGASVWTGLLLGAMMSATGAAWHGACDVRQTGDERWRRAVRAGERVGLASGQLLGPAAALVAAEMVAVGVALVGVVPLDASQWWTGVIALVALTAAACAWTWRLDRADGRDDETSTPREPSVAVNARAVSPFYEGGPGFEHAHLSPRGELRNARLGGAVHDMAEL